ncbi:hypothetical protein BDZ85DRAFT_230194 [Elsinoe ampelina]|uniref:Uncharacterized protein n=1 Tax=Elsinoe ampelina TaxID=302913 RepID=A0A6A6GLP9_9PEZI|nr:hypothetical protein BDZ85DRAFT_230194 [Elsinoe ampelina]
MGIIKKAFALTGWGTLAGAGTLAWYTRKSKIMPLPTSDYLPNTTLYSRLNVHENQTMQDICIRKVPISSIKPEYLEPNGKLAEKFCAGVWSTWGYAYQRRYLERKYRDQTPTQLWDTKDLAASTYEVGTYITDHFEVLSKTPESVIVRCGDSPRVQEPRASDGLFEMVAIPDKENGEVEFQLKSVFFNADAKKEGSPMPKHVEILHRWYTKVWMESAVRSLLK